MREEERKRREERGKEQRRGGRNEVEKGTDKDIHMFMYCRIPMKNTQEIRLLSRMETK